MDQRRDRLCRAIGQIWQKGRVLSPDDLFFLESVCGITRGEELENALTQDDFPDKEMVLEMVMHPDQSMRMAVESVMDPEGMALRQKSRNGY